MRILPRLFTTTFWDGFRIRQVLISGSGLLDAERVGRDQFILSVLGGTRVTPPDATPEFIAQQAIDRQYLSDKTDIGAYFSIHKGLSNVSSASQAMGLFDGSSASIAAAVSQIDNVFAAAQDPLSGEFLMPLIGVLDDPFAMS
jgi:hypothetical protein